MTTAYEPITLSLDDPDHRNALSLAMFDRMDAFLANASDRVLLLRGEGPVFCAGFDLKAAVADSSLMGTYIHRLSGVLRALRRHPMPVVAVVQGAAIAGGCALLSACDFVVASRGAKLGYPVHAIGVSPAVTLPTLMQAIGPGAARSLTMSGAVIDGEAAYDLGLVTHLSESDETVMADAQTLAQSLAEKPAGALRVTKAWLNELDGSLEDALFDATATASADAAVSDEAIELLRSVWGR